MLAGSNSKHNDTDSQSNLTKALSDKGPEWLLRWLGTPSEEFKALNTFSDVTPKWVRIERSYTVRRKYNRLFLVVMLPHPEQRTSAEYGLIEQFAAFKPPTLKVRSTQNLVLQERYRASLYRHRDTSTCSVHLPFVNSAFLDLRIPKCNDTELQYGKRLLNSLNLQLLEEKLKS